MALTIEMITTICVLNIFGLYITCCYVYLQHSYYFRTLFGKTKSSKFKKTKTVFSRVAPMYKQEYLGYEGFVLYDLNKKVMVPHKYLRVFGIIHPYSECLVLYKGSTVKSVLVLSDKRYVEEMFEAFRKTYRNVIIIINGGVVLWQVCSQYLIF